MLDKVILEEDPGAAHLGAGDLSAARALAQLLGMDMQELRGFAKRVGLHAASWCRRGKWHTVRAADRVRGRRHANVDAVFDPIHVRSVRSLTWLAQGCQRALSARAGSESGESGSREGFVRANGIDLR